MDVHDRKSRSYNMSRIRGKDTRPELLIRRELHGNGFRYRLHDSRLPGKPDIYLPRYKAVVQIHGCFWHGHECEAFRWPATRQQFWRDKILRTRENDIRNQSLIQQAGLRNAIVWECALKGRTKQPLSAVVSELCRWLRWESGPDITISGIADAGEGREPL